MVLIQLHNAHSALLLLLLLKATTIYRHISNLQEKILSPNALITFVDS